MAEPVECLLSKRLDSLQVRELEGNDGHAVLGLVKSQGIIRRSSSIRISSPEYDSIGLGLAQKLLNGFESLELSLVGLSDDAGMGAQLDPTRRR